MLVLSRRFNESVIIGEGIEVRVIDIRGDRVRLGFTAPDGTPIDRQEVWEAKRRERLAAEGAGQ